MREALVTDDVDDGVEGGWKVWKEWYVLVIVLVCYAYRLDLFLSQCFRLLKLPKANLLFCNFKINWKILHKDHFSGRMSCLKLGSPN